MKLGMFLKIEVSIGRERRPFGSNE